MLKDYFFKDGRLRKEMINDQDKNKVNNFYKSILLNNVDNKYIKEYKKNYIKIVIKPEKDKLTKYKKYSIDNRIKEIRKLVRILN